MCLKEEETLSCLTCLAMFSRVWYTCEFLPAGRTLISNWSAKHVSVRCGQHFVQRKSVKAAQTQRGPLFWAGPPQTAWQISGKNWDMFYLPSYLNIFRLTGNETIMDSFQHQWRWEAGTYWFLNQFLLLLWASHLPSMPRLLSLCKCGSDTHLIT